MPRLPRLRAESGYYHVLNRGARRTTTFRDDHDRQSFLGVLAEGCNRFDTKVHAYCLMTNHYHLLLRGAGGTDDDGDGVSRTMHFLGTVYTQRFNKRYELDGALFSGRFRSEAVETDDYFLTLVRYIHRNPLAIDGVSALEDYPWSSHRLYLPPETRLRWFEPGVAMALLGQSTQAYREHVESAGDDDVIIDSTDPTSCPRPEAVPAPPENIDKIESLALELMDTDRWQSSRTRVARQLTLLAATRRGCASTSGLAERLGFASPSSLRSALARARQRVEDDPDFAELLSLMLTRLGP